MNKIIGQSGDKSNAKKLLNWLKNWHRHRELGTKPVSRCKLCCLLLDLLPSIVAQLTCAVIGCLVGDLVQFHIEGVCVTNLGSSELSSVGSSTYCTTLDQPFCLIQHIMH